LKPKELEKRVDRIQGPEPDSHRFDMGAYAGWVVRHLSDAEQARLCDVIKELEEDSVGWQEREQLLTEGARIQKLAEERARKGPSEAYEKFKSNWIRAETLRHTGRRLTNAEHNELMALNAWLQGRAVWKGETEE